MAGGLLYGEFFGPTGVVPALWLKPLDEPTRMLAGALAVGGALLAAAYLLGIVSRWREGGPGLAVYSASGITGGLLFAGLAIAALGVIRHLPATVAAGDAVAVLGLGAAAIGLHAASGGGGAGLAQTGVELFPDGAALIAAEAAFRTAVPAAVQAAVEHAAVRALQDAVTATRRQVRVLRRHWIPTLAAALAAVDTALEQADHEDTVRRTAWAGPGRSTLPGPAGPAKTEGEEARGP